MKEDVAYLTTNPQNFLSPHCNHRKWRQGAPTTDKLAGDHLTLVDNLSTYQLNRKTSAEANGALVKSRVPGYLTKFMSLRMPKENFGGVTNSNDLISFPLFSGLRTQRMLTGRYY